MRRWTLTSLLLLLLAGCTAPLSRSSEEALRESLMASHHAFLEATAPGQVKLARTQSPVQLDLTQRKLKEKNDQGEIVERPLVKVLDEQSGPDSYSDARLIVGADLYGKNMRDLYERMIDNADDINQLQKDNAKLKEEGLTDEEQKTLDANSKRIEELKAENVKLEESISKLETQRVQMSLQQAIRLAVQHNIDLQVAQFGPAIRQSQLVQAKARFDATVFADLNFTTQETPRPATAVPNLGSRQDSIYTLETGIRKNLTTGAQVSLSTSLARNWGSPALFSTNPYYDTDILLSIQQPLLRNFGTDVNKAEIQLVRSARKQAVEELRLSVINVANNVESAYWQLVQRRQQLLIQFRLFERTRAERKRLKPRRGFDVKPATYTDVLAREEQRRADLVRASQAVRQASDLLKRLINSPDLPLSGETLIMPTDGPPDLPVVFSLIDAVTTGLRARPEMESALLQIKDAGIRRRLADNGRLPVLNLVASMAYRGVGDNWDTSYGRLFDGDFIDYIVGLQFEMPIGNRGPEALLTQRTLERQQSVMNYRRQAQDVIQEVKDALREVQTAYELIGVTRSSRRASAENLRTIKVEEEAGAELNPNFIDLKLRRQESLAAAEVDEFNALVSYNVAISNLYRAMGTLLKRNNIEFDPDARPE